jgi:16S rRNA (uracil1498-N3)-methyltransferase
VVERHDHPAIACFYAEGAIDAGATVLLGHRAAHHATVRRIEAGDPVAITNGDGFIGRGTIARLAKGEMEIAIEHVEEFGAPSEIRLCAPVADRDRMLWAAEKATELGLSSWQSVRFRRSSSVSPRGEGAAFGEKLRARMIGALEQSFGAWLPRILPDAVPLEVDAGDALRVVLDASGEPILDLLSLRDSSLAVLVGPEGGIESDELERLVAAGWRRASLGASTLRFETAATAAVAVIRAVHASQLSLGVDRAR